jgi:hypothetical protein
VSSTFCGTYTAPPRQHAQLAQLPAFCTDATAFKPSIQSSVALLCICSSAASLLSTKQGFPLNRSNVQQPIPRQGALRTASSPF